MTIDWYENNFREAVRGNVKLYTNDLDDLEFLYDAQRLLIEIVDELQELIEEQEADLDAAFACIDCEHDTRDEYYMVHDHVWLAAAESKKDGMLCIGCLEKRLGRTLTKEDFTGYPVNDTDDPTKSERLMNRLTTCLT